MEGRTNRNIQTRNDFQRSSRFMALAFHLGSHPLCSMVEWCVSFLPWFQDGCPFWCHVWPSIANPWSIAHMVCTLVGILSLWLLPPSHCLPKTKSHKIRGKHSAQRARFSSKGKKVENELFQTKSNYILKAEAGIFWQNCQDVTKRLKDFFFVI